MSQTGGGCRASNYIHLLRKALEKAGMGYIPVISISFGLEKNPGFHLTIPLLRRLIYAMMYGDLIMNVANQVRPYEVNAGETDALVETWKNRLIDRFQQGKGMSRKQMQAGFKEICDAFKAVPVENFGSKVRGGGNLHQVLLPGQQPAGKVPPQRGGGTGGAWPDRLPDF